jgi:putative membrane protein
MPREFSPGAVGKRRMQGAFGNHAAVSRFHIVMDTITTGTSEKLTDTADRRTELAADRTVLAAERTYAAWVRTGLAALASGVGSKKLLAGVIPDWGVEGIGCVLVLFAAFSFAAGVWREMYPGAPPPKPDIRRIPAAVLISVNGCLILVALSALFSVLFGRTGG